MKSWGRNVGKRPSKQTTYLFQLQWFSNHFWAYIALLTHILWKEWDVFITTCLFIYHYIENYPKTYMLKITRHCLSSKTEAEIIHFGVPEAPGKNSSYTEMITLERSFEDFF